MISPSIPEPRCDVSAQITALRDPAHPKAAVWLARGTAAPVDLLDGLIMLSLPQGLLLTTDVARARHLAANQSDDGLAVVLGYPEAKSQLVDPIVIQARDAAGCVVSEMACSAGHAIEAALWAAAHGGVAILTLPEALARRIALCQAEN